MKVGDKIKIRALTDFHTDNIRAGSVYDAEIYKIWGNNVYFMINGGTDTWLICPYDFELFELIREKLDPRLG